MENARVAQLLAPLPAHSRRFDALALRRPVVERAAPLPVRRPLRPGRLSPRTFQVLCLIADGLSNKEIALALAVSEETVKTHLKNLLDGLGAANRAHAVAIGFREGLLGLEPVHSAA